jgi:hypothetical protein
MAPFSRLPSPPHSPLSLGLSCLALVLSLGNGVALAQPVGPAPRAGRLTPEQREKVFPEQRRLTLRDHRARITILQKGESCIASASGADALRECLRTEREAMGQQRRLHMTELQALYERIGLPMPQWKRLDKPRGPRPEAGLSDT